LLKPVFSFFWAVSRDFVLKAKKVLGEPTQFFRDTIVFRYIIHSKGEENWF
jgi:hypothetical protein